MSIDTNSAGSKGDVGHVFSLVAEGRACSVSELVEETGLARSTLGFRLDWLVEAGLLTATKTDSGSRGRSPKRYSFNPGYGHVLTAQVGLTATRVAITDLQGEILTSTMLQDLDTADGYSALLERVSVEFTALREEIGSTAGELVGIGVGVPDELELANHLRTHSDSVDGADGQWWERARTALSTQFLVPVFLDHDVNLISRAETQASGTQQQRVMCVKVGTNLSASLMFDGNIMRGGLGGVSQIGHVHVDGRDRLCSCGNTGCLNTIASGQALVRELVTAGFPVQNTRDLVRLANLGEPLAVRAIRDAAQHIGKVLSSAINLMCLDSIIIWGYLAEVEQHFLSGVKESVFRYGLPSLANHCEISPAKLGNDAGISGAAMLVTEHLLSARAIQARFEAYR